MSLEITSPAFKSGDPIPTEYTCEGKNVSPPLSWRGVPKQAKSLALICDDPDAAPGPGGENHRYIFRLYALSEDPDLPPDANLAQVLDSILDQVVDQAECIGQYAATR